MDSLSSHCGDDDMETIIPESEYAVSKESQSPAIPAGNMFKGLNKLFTTSAVMKDELSSPVIPVQDFPFRNDPTSHNEQGDSETESVSLLTNIPPLPPPPPPQDGGLPNPDLEKKSSVPKETGRNVDDFGFSQTQPPESGFEIKEFSQVPSLHDYAFSDEVSIMRDDDSETQASECLIPLAKKQAVPSTIKPGTFIKTDPKVNFRPQNCESGLFPRTDSRIDNVPSSIHVDEESVVSEVLIPVIPSAKYKPPNTVCKPSDGEPRPKKWKPLESQGTDSSKETSSGSRRSDVKLLGSTSKYQKTGKVTNKLIHQKHKKAMTIMEGIEKKQNVISGQLEKECTNTWKEKLKEETNRLQDVMNQMSRSNRDEKEEIAQVVKDGTATREEKAYLKQWLTLLTLRQKKLVQVMTNNKQILSMFGPSGSVGKQGIGKTRIEKESVSQSTWSSSQKSSKVKPNSSGSLKSLEADTLSEQQRNVLLQKAGIAVTTLVPPNIETDSLDKGRSSHDQRVIQGRTNMQPDCSTILPLTKDSDAKEKSLSAKLQVAKVYHNLGDASQLSSEQCKRETVINRVPVLAVKASEIQGDKLQEKDIGVQIVKPRLGPPLNKTLCNLRQKDTNVVGSQGEHTTGLTLTGHQAKKKVVIVNFPKDNSASTGRNVVVGDSLKQSVIVNPISAKQAHTTFLVSPSAMSAGASHMSQGQTFAKDTTATMPAVPKTNLRYENQAVVSSVKKFEPPFTGKMMNRQGTLKEIDQGISDQIGVFQIPKGLGEVKSGKLGMLDHSKGATPVLKVVSTAQGNVKSIHPISVTIDLTKTTDSSTKPSPAASLNSAKPRTEHLPKPGPVSTSCAKPKPVGPTMKYPRPVYKFGGYPHRPLAPSMTSDDSSISARRFKTIYPGLVNRQTVKVKAKKKSKDSKLKQLVDQGILMPGKDVLSIVTTGTTFRASLNVDGKIQSAGGEIFQTPMSWCMAALGTLQNMKMAYQKVLYNGKPLETFMNQLSDVPMTQIPHIPVMPQPMRELQKIPILQPSATLSKPLLSEINNSRDKGQEALKTTKPFASEVVKVSTPTTDQFNLCEMLSKCKLHLIDDKEIFPASSLPHDVWTKETFTEDTWQAIDVW